MSHNLRISILCLSILALGILVSCEESTSEDQLTLIYKPIMEKEYQTTERLFNLGTSDTWILVPDTLLDYVDFTLAELDSGLANRSAIIEQTLLVDTSDASVRYEFEYRNTEYAPKKVVYEYMGNQTYSLESAIQRLEQGLEYNAGWGWGLGQFFYEDENGLYTLHPEEDILLLQFPIDVGTSWIRSSMTLNAGLPNELTINDIAEVVSFESVSVLAGEFDAYKVVITPTYQTSGNQRPPTVEYWVENVGLILSERDYQKNSFTVGESGTTSVRCIKRTELVDY